MSETTTSSSASNSQTTPHTSVRHSMFTPPTFYPPLPFDHPQPQTAPIPEMSTFLGSPFSSKTARGSYRYSTSDSPSRSRMASEPSDRVTSALQNNDFNESSEWMVEMALDDHDRIRDYDMSDMSPLADMKNDARRSRRFTSGSTASSSRCSTEESLPGSSIGCGSGSGCSSASLLSLAGRSSDEHRSRPGVTIWNEYNFNSISSRDSIIGGGMGGNDDSTPIRQLFVERRDVSDTEDFVQMSRSKGKKKEMDSVQSLSAGPDISPLGEKKSRKSSLSPLTQIIRKSPSILTLTGNKSKSTTINTNSEEKVTKRRSPFSSFIPRLLPSRKSTLNLKKSQLAQKEVDGEMTDTDEISSPRIPPRTSSALYEPSSVGSRSTIMGLGITSSINMDRSFSMESNGDIASPSKPPSASSTSNKLASLDINALPTKSIPRSKTATFAVPNLPSSHHDSASSKSAFSDKGKSAIRPTLKRGITEPSNHLLGRQTPDLLHPHQVHTPPTALFDDIKPSPLAFASTGLIKKKSNLPMLEIPRFGEKSSPVRSIMSYSPAKTEIDSPGSPLRSKMDDSVETLLPPQRKSSLNYRPTDNAESSSSVLTGIGAGPSGGTSGDVPPALQLAQKTRGLRRKGSSMFTASGSIGSIGGLASGDKGSPSTPTKNPSFKLTPFGALGITTPSPTQTRSSFYPFGTSSHVHSITSSPPRIVSIDEIDLDTLEEDDEKLTSKGGGPLLRASNPMLVSTYNLHGQLVIIEEGKTKRNRLDKDFILVQSLGAGAFSQVWKVKDKRDGSLWAVKAGKPYTGTKNRLRQLEEVSILRSLSIIPHPNILNYVDSWEFQQRLYLQTELAECGDLSKFLDCLGDSGGLGEIRSWKLLSELSSALTFIHDRQILHLDIKPSNVLITKSGSVKLADFGMSVICDDDGFAGDLSPALPHLDSNGGFTWSDFPATPMESPSSSGNGNEKRHSLETSSKKINTVPSPIIDREIEGDREYLSPESLSTAKVSKEADIFSLGIMILESVLNVVLPSNGDGWVKLRNDDFSDITEHYIPRSALNEGERTMVTVDGLPVISVELLNVIKGMMRRSKDERMTLKDIGKLRIMRKIKEGMESKKFGPACLEESQEVIGWLFE